MNDLMIVGILSTISGIACIVIALCMYKHFHDVVNKRKFCKLKVVADVIDVEKKRNVFSKHNMFNYLYTYSYIVDNIQYVGKAQIQEDYGGDTTKVLYVNENNPEEFVEEGEYITAMIVSIACYCFIALGIFLPIFCILTA